MTEKYLGSTKVSPNWQTTVLKEARPFLEVNKGERIAWYWKEGEVVLRKCPSQQ